MPKATWQVWGATLGLLSTAAHAQSTDAVESNSIDTGGSIIVLATKREALIQDVPVAVSALSADQLNDAGLTNVDGIADVLPTLDVQRNAGLTTTSLRIRRVGNIGNIPTFEPAVGVFVDGAFRSRSFFGTSNLLAVDHVEVLRGPQTTLYGKNVSAGLFALYTHLPAQQWHAQAELTQGWIDSPHAADMDRMYFDVSGPLGSNSGAGLAGEFRRHGHTLENVLDGGPDGDDENQFASRGQLAWTPTDSLNLRLLAGYLRENDDQGESDVYLAPGAASTQVSGLLRQLELTPGCADDVPRNRRLCSVATNQLDLRASDVTLLGEYRLDNGWAVRSMTSWDEYRILRKEDDAIQLYAPILFYRDAEYSHSAQEELRLESPSDAALSWLIGAFYYRNDYSRGDHGRVPMFGANGDLAYASIWPVLLGIPLAVPGQLGLHDSQLQTRYGSFFAQASWQVAPSWTVIAGARWQKEDKDATINNAVTVPGISLISAVLTPATTLDGRPVNGSLARSSENVPWSITVQHRLGKESMAYATVSRAAKSGGFNTGFGDAPLASREFGDERIRHHELGAKGTFLDHRLGVSAAAFHTIYDDYQDSAFISAQFSVGNAERVDLQGVEVEGSVRLQEHLTLGFSTSYVELRYDKDTHGLCYPGREPDGSVPNSCVLSGSPLIQAPDWETHVDLNYARPVSWGEWWSRLDWSYTSRYNTSFSADPRLTQKPYHDVSARVGTQIGNSLQLVLWGENLLNENISYFDSLLNLFNDASYQSYLAIPRSYGLTLKVSF